MLKEINEKLEILESEKKVKILYACESGSRAWGFHSPDSDYDVRFLYIHEKEWYLSIEDKKDFIDLPVNEVFDINGYDIRKALKLFRASNCKIYEWVQSPVIYKSDDSFLQDLKSLVAEYYSPLSGLHHYLGLTRNTLNNDLQGDQIKLKKYFYALRPVLAACWIAEKGECPPMEFKHLRTLIKSEMIDKKIDNLMHTKLQVPESHLIAPDEALHQFITDKMELCEKHAQTLHKKESTPNSLNYLFRKTAGL